MSKEGCKASGLIWYSICIYAIPASSAPFSPPLTPHCGAIKHMKCGQCDWAADAFHVLHLNQLYNLPSPCVAAALHWTLQLLAEKLQGSLAMRLTRCIASHCPSLFQGQSHQTRPQMQETLPRSEGCPFPNRTTCTDNISISKGRKSTKGCRSKSLAFRGITGLLLFPISRGCSGNILHHHLLFPSPSSQHHTAAVSLLPLPKHMPANVWLPSYIMNSNRLWVIQKSSHVLWCFRKTCLWSLMGIL